MGRTLRATRKRKKLAAVGLARLSKVDRTYISQLERGIRQPTIAIFLSLAKALEIEPTDLLSDVVEELRK